MHKENNIQQVSSRTIETLLGELADERRWVCQNNKIPYAVDSSAEAKCAGPTLKHKSSWGTYEEALAACKAKGLSGIGIVLGECLVGIDIDHIGDMAEGDTMVEDIVRLMDSYTEVSPSGDGIHILFRVLPETLGYLTSYKNKNTKDGIEIYWANRYFTFTGNVVNDQSVMYRDSEAKEFCKRFMPLKQKSQVLPKSSQKATRPKAPAKKQGRDKFDPKRNRQDATVISDACEYDDVFQPLYMGQWSQLGYSSRSEADLALISRLFYWTGRDVSQTDRLFRKSELMRPKWDEHRGGISYGDLTIEKAMSSNYSSPKYQRDAREKWRKSKAKKYRGRHGNL